MVSHRHVFVAAFTNRDIVDYTFDTMLSHFVTLSCTYLKLLLCCTVVYFTFLLLSLGCSISPFLTSFLLFHPITLHYIAWPYFVILLYLTLLYDTSQTPNGVCKHFSGDDLLRKMKLNPSEEH